MQSGHSVLPNDADFGVIEKTSRQQQRILIPDHWQHEVARALKRKPFTVLSMQSRDFIDLRAMSKQLVNIKKSVDGLDVKWLQIKTISFKPDDPYIIQIQYAAAMSHQSTTLTSENLVLFLN